MKNGEEKADDREANRQVFAGSTADHARPASANALIFGNSSPIPSFYARGTSSAPAIKKRSTATVRPSRDL